MTRWIAFSAMVVGLLLVGCAGPQMSPGAVTSREDTFLPYREVSTTSFEAVQPGGDRIRGHLGARRDKATGTLTIHAILGVVYGQKLVRHYETARNNRAGVLSIRRILHDGAGCRRAAACAHAELFQVDIPEADLRRALRAGEGYPIKLFDRTGSTTLFPISKELVAALFKEVDTGAPAASAGQQKQARQ